MSDPKVLKTADGRQIAYHRVDAEDSLSTQPGVVFLGGFRSDMEGSKALSLERWARQHGRAYLRFDYTGHGASSGRFEDGSIGDWALDAQDAITELTQGPQILVGSSMGGWIALILTRRIPERIAGLIGIAAAPDFTEDSMWTAASVSERRSLTRNGRVEVPSEYSEDPYVITQHLIEEGRNHLVLRSPLKVNFPVRLLHGTADLDVPLEVALRLLAHIEGEDVQAIVSRGSDHRMSEERDLQLLQRTFNSIL